MFKIALKHKSIVVVVMMFVLMTTFFSQIVSMRVSKMNGYTIVLDAGHGGRDGGSVGLNGTIEKEINLEYVLALKEKLVRNGFKVILTRENDDGLYSEFAKNKKQSDMNARYKIIKEVNPNLVISIHMNSFHDSQARGATTYYRANDKASKLCADLIQSSLKTFCDAKYLSGKAGDYFILNCSYYSAVLIECGFISNPREEKLLNSDEYKNKMIDAIYKGILLYFGNKQI